MDNPPSGMIQDETGELIGFHITLDDFSQLQNLLIQLSTDPGTQPAYGRGIFRALGAFQKVLSSGAPPQQGIKNPTVTDRDFNFFRSGHKNVA